MNINPNDKVGQSRNQKWGGGGGGGGGATWAIALWAGLIFVFWGPAACTW